MSGNRALFWNEHIGGNQFRLRISNNNPRNNKQWWAFDSRTRTIRALSRRSHVIANQQGQGFKIGRAAVIRKYTGNNSEKIIYYLGQRRNIRNQGGKCLDVWGGRNVHNQQTTFWNCHNGLNQAWLLVKRLSSKKNVGFKQNKSFRIKSMSNGGRVFFVAERLKNNQYRLRIRSPQHDDRELFYYDSKTKTIRFKKDRRFVLSLEEGQFKRGRNMVMRPFKGSNDQRFFFRNHHLHNF